MVLTKQEKRSKLIMTMIVGVVALLFISPLLWMLSSSFKRPYEVFEVPFRWFPREVMWSNYITVWFEANVTMIRCYWNSIQIVVFSVAGSLVFASMAAYAFAKIKFAGKGIVFSIFLSSMMIPGQVTIIPRFMLFKTLGIYNTLWAIILPGLFSATAIFMLRQFYMGLPDDLMESAKIDGAGHFRIFIQIMLPLTKAALVSLMILSFIGSWNEYLSPLIFLTKENLYTVAQCVRWWMLEESGNMYNMTMAASTSAIIPVVILFVSCQKYFVEGIATSGVKG